MNNILRGLILGMGLLIFWELSVKLFHLPDYILPTPANVLKITYEKAELIANEAVITFLESGLGLILGILIGCAAALFMSWFKPVSFWLWPLLLISQAIPTFALAPLLVIWFGYGMASKIVMTIIMLFFPITTAFYDGLRSTPEGFLDLAKTMNATPRQVYWHIRIPAALPHLASGIRVATAIAPIGAIVGEWVGASKGLGFLMLNANARLQIDLMFASLITIIIFSLALYFCVDRVLRKIVYWERII